MECNKEEALRAMDIAKIKLSQNDYNGAKKFSEKAKDLYMKLDGLKQVSMLIDVYISARNRIIGGEYDWYAILGVDPLADEEAVKRQYKRLALLLHPDKNKCDGAEAAFKLVLEAWSLLSDKVKRVAFDVKRKSKEVKPKKSRKPKQPPNQRQQQQPPNQPKQQQPNKPKQPPPNQPSSRAKTKKPTLKVSTFWTMCNKCKTEYEYVRVYYLNKTLRCRNCSETFKATEKDKTQTEKEKKTQQETKENTDGASSCGREPSLTVSVGYSFRWDSSLSRMGCFYSGNVANQAEERAKRGVPVSQEKDENAASSSRGIASSGGFKEEERFYKKLKTDSYAVPSSGIKV
ncbi:unnamed protein product [Cochlearia groenlandica]